MAAEIEIQVLVFGKLWLSVQVGRKYGNGKREKSMSIYCRMAIRLWDSLW